MNINTTSDAIHMIALAIENKDADILEKVEEKVSEWLMVGTEADALSALIGAAWVALERFDEMDAL